MKDQTRKSFPLESCKDAPNRILAALRREGKVHSGQQMQTNFEHGQWWVTNLYTGEQWSVVETTNGIGFEQVTPPMFEDEEAGQ